MPIRWFLSLPDADLIAEGALSKILDHQDFNAPRNVVVDLANYTPASAEKGYLSAARYMSSELLSRFEPVARAQLKQVVTNRISQFFAVDSEKVAVISWLSLAH